MVPTDDRSIAAPAQHKQPSRKGKKAWRKNVDVSDVQTGLEEVREELIKGGIIKEKSSDSLFTLDPSGSEAIQRSYNKIHKPLKADEILAQRSAIEKIATHKRPHGTTDGVIESSSSKKRKTDGVSPQEYERLRQVAYNGQQMRNSLKTSSQEQGFDPWAVDPTANVIDPRFDYLDKEKPIVAPRTLKEAPISLIQSGKALPAVRKPKAGTSYNPLFEDWSALLEGEGEKAVVAERKRLSEAKVEMERLERIAAAREEIERADGWVTEEESAWEGFESDYAGEEGLKKQKRSERKTPQERRKVERRKENERREKAERKEKERARGEKRIPAIKKQVDVEARQRSISLASGEKEGENGAADEEEEEEDADDAILPRRKLGKDVLPSAPLELVLPDELQDSLRLLKPEGNLLKERFRSYMLRGQVETRPKPIQQAKKKRRTVTEKWTYKDFKVGA